MTLTTLPRIWPVVTLIGSDDSQREAVRKACLLAMSRRARAVIVTMDDGRVIAGAPLPMLSTFSSAELPAD